MKSLPVDQLQHLLRFACPVCCAKAGELCNRKDNRFRCPERPQESPAPKRAPRKAKKKAKKKERDVKPGKFAGINRANRARARKPSEGKLAAKRTKPERVFLEWLAQEKEAGRVLDFREQRAGRPALPEDASDRPDRVASTDVRPAPPTSERAWAASPASRCAKNCNG